MKDGKRTIGDFYEEVFAIHDEKAARAYFEAEVKNIQAQIDAGTWQSQYDAVTAARLNIGWVFGEGMPKQDIEMWVKVCGARHPVFGAMLPSPEDAFKMGYDWAKEK